MTDALNNLSEKDQNLINSNLYKQAIDYNNNLEKWIDKSWMTAATNVKRWINEHILDNVYLYVPIYLKNKPYPKGIKYINPSINQGLL